MNILPPGVKSGWEDNSVLAQSDLIAFNQIREMEETKELAALAGVRMNNA